jgi:hypothetical protein
MFKITIPEIGSKLKLTKDWCFRISHSKDNESFFQIFDKSYKFSYGVTTGSLEAIIPKGTILSIDRLNISRGSGIYNSIKFSIPKRINNNSLFGGTKFYATLSDSNNIEFELIDCNQQTLDLATSINKSILKLTDGNIRKAEIFIKAIIGATTGIKSFRPQETPTVFLKKAIAKLNKIKHNYYYYYNNQSEFENIKTELISTLEADLRKLKIQNVVETEMS